MKLNGRASPEARAAAHLKAAVRYRDKANAHFGRAEHYRALHDHEFGMESEAPAKTSRAPSEPATAAPPFKIDLKALGLPILHRILQELDGDKPASYALLAALAESGYRGLPDLIERAPHSLLGRVNTPAWVRIIASSGYTDEKLAGVRDICDMRYTWRVHGLCDIARGPDSPDARTAKWLLARLLDLGGCTVAMAELLHAGIRGDAKRWTKLPPIVDHALVSAARDGNGTHPVYGPLDVWDTRSGTTTSGAFSGDVAAGITNLAFWDTCGVKNMRGMFEESKVQYTGLRSWNTSRVQNMSSMFAGCGAFNEDIQDWDTGDVADMELMFQDARAFNADLRRWDTRKVTNAEGAFSGCGIADANRFVAPMPLVVA